MARGSDVDRVLRQAIAERRLVAFEYEGLPRVGEPHDYGKRNGKDQLNFYQTGGQSRKGAVPGWRTPAVLGIRSLTLMPEGFAGTRLTRSGRHLDWDELYATVTPR